MTIIWLDRAVERLIEIHDYISLESQGAASRITQKLFVALLHAHHVLIEFRRFRPFLSREVYVTGKFVFHNTKIRQILTSTVN